MKVFLRSSSFVLASLLSGGVFAGCGGGSSSLDTKPIDLPLNTAVLNLTATKSADSNYRGDVYKGAGGSYPDDFPISNGTSNSVLLVERVKNTPSVPEGGISYQRFSMLLPAPFTTGEVFELSVGGQAKCLLSQLIHKAVDEPSTWDTSVSALGGGKIKVLALSDTAVKLQFQHVVLPPDGSGGSVSKGTITLDGTITASLRETAN